MRMFWICFFAVTSRGLFGAAEGDICYQTRKTAQNFSVMSVQELLDKKNELLPSLFIHQLAQARDDFPARDHLSYKILVDTIKAQENKEAIFVAVKGSSVEFLNMLVEDVGFDVNQVNESGRIALHLSVYNSVKFMCALLRLGITQDLQDRERNTALDVLKQEQKEIKNYVEKCNLLRIAAEGSIDEHYAQALMSDERLSVEFILADKDVNGSVFFDRVINLGDKFPSSNDPLYRLLVDTINEKEWRAPDRKGLNTLHYAARGSSTELMRILIDTCELSMDQISNDGEAPLHWAVYSTLEMLEFALKNSSKSFVDLQDKDEGSHKRRAPLHYVSRITEGAKKKSNFLDYISAKDACAKITLLKQYGANLNLQDGRWGRTALHWSIHNPIQVMQTLLKLDADPNVQDHEAKTVLDLLKMSKSTISEHSEKYALLLSYGAKCLGLLSVQNSSKPSAFSHRCAQADVRTSDTSTDWRKDQGAASSPNIDQSSSDSKNWRTSREPIERYNGGGQKWDKFKSNRLSTSQKGGLRSNGSSNASWREPRSDEVRPCSRNARW